MSKHFSFSFLYLIGSFTQFAIAAPPPSDMQWDRNSAMAAVRTVNIDVAVYEIGDISSLADDVSTLSRLRSIETRSDWPLPAREATIYQFTRSLAELPRDAVAVEVMQYLRGFQPRVLVEHEDHGEAFVPLFNIRGAAAGVENGWQRAEFAMKAMVLIETNPAALVSGYTKSTNNNQRSGYLDALGYAETRDVMAVQAIALKQLGKAPELTPLVAATTINNADISAIEQLLIHGRGAGLSSALEQLSRGLDVSEKTTLLVHAIEHAPTTNAALAMAAWWPGLRHEPAVRDLMMDQLGDPALGASAALALAQSPDIQTIKALKDTALSDSPAGRRAQMALDFNRSNLTGEVRP